MVYCRQSTADDDSSVELVVAATEAGRRHHRATSWRRGKCGVGGAGVTGGLQRPRRRHRRRRRRHVAAAAAAEAASRTSDHRTAGESAIRRAGDVCRRVQSVTGRTTANRRLSAVPAPVEPVTTSTTNSGRTVHACSQRLQLVLI